MNSPVFETLSLQHVKLYVSSWKSFLSPSRSEYPRLFIEKFDCLGSHDIFNQPKNSLDNAFVESAPLVWLPFLLVPRC